MLRWWLLVLVAGCYSPSYTNGGFLCGKCPAGYHCALDGTCWQNGQDPDLSGSGPLDLASADLTPVDLTPSQLPEGGTNLIGGVEPLGGGRLPNGTYFLTEQSLVVGDSSCAGSFCLVGGITP
jgi:hypothetical protein